MRIPDEKIDEIRAAADIVDVISSFVSLKKRGKNFLGLCPFHQEKTPSFSVSPEKQMYHCFGCGVGGNVFTFVMEYEKVSFIEAVRSLAERVGISLPAEGAEDRAQATENEALYNACRSAGLFFHENLMTTTEGKLTLEYFRHRGFTDETIRKFGLGYSLHSWDALLHRAEEEHIDMGILEKAGLALRREDGSGLYDRFRGRAMFPIFSPTGRTIAFGARKMREDDPMGKYINSPETPIYNKSRVLYGLSHAKDAIREKVFAIVVEGYADLISVFQSGTENIVASSGTALTEEQVQLVGRYAPSITLVYDADSAGSKATLRGVDLIIGGGLEVRVAALPEGEDPDSYVKRYGGEAFRKLLAASVSFLDFKAEAFRAQGLLENPEGKTRAVRSLVETIATMKDELKRNFYVKSIAEKYNIYESVLFRELERVLGQERSRQQFVSRKDSGTTPAASTAPSARPTTGQDIPAAERDLLKVMLEHGHTMAQFVFSHVGPELFTHPAARAVITLIESHGSNPWEVNALINEIDNPGLRRLVTDIVFTRYDISKGWAQIGSEPHEPTPEEVAEASIIVLQRREIDRKIAGLFQQLKSAGAGGEELAGLQQQILQLQRDRKELQSKKFVRS